MSRKILGQVGGTLADILDIQGGQVSIDQLRDREGVGVVWDLERTAEALLVVPATRTFTQTLATNTSAQVQVLNLPSLARIVSVDMATDNETRIDSTWLAIRHQNDQRDSFIAWWKQGDDTFAAPGNLIVAGAPTRVLQLNHKLPQTFVSQDTQVRRFGDEGIQFGLSTTAFGAGTVTVSGNLRLLFFFGLGGRSNPVGLPSW